MEKPLSSLNKKINTASVVQQVIDALTAAMINRELRPGDKIPTEIELSESLGVGRLSIREAIKVLVYYGVLEIRRPEGTFVRDGFSGQLIDPMLYGIILHADDSYASIKELRQMMEVGVIRLAAKKAGEADRQRLLDRFEALKAALERRPAGPDAVFAADDEFHRALSEMGGNPLIDRINSLVRILTYDLRLRTVRNMIEAGEQAQLLEAHRQICEAVLSNRMEDIEAIVERGYFYHRIKPGE